MEATIKSKHAERFNHDPDAAGYDHDVRDEEHPIRAGYDSLLQWVAVEANSRGGATLDLGSGTGNLGQRLTNFSKLTCVDISENMTAIARQKLAKKPNVSFARSDILQFFDTSHEQFDTVASTYAIHHLTDEEKKSLFRNVIACLSSGGIAVFGDLMFEDTGEKKRILEALLAEGQKDLVDDINDEFFWDLQSTKEAFAALGCRAESKRFSELSWGLLVRKP